MIVQTQSGAEYGGNRNVAKNDFTFLPGPLTQVRSRHKEPDCKLRPRTPKPSRIRSHSLLPVLSNVDIFCAAVSFCAHSDPTNELNSCCLFGTDFARRTDS